MIDKCIGVLKNVDHNARRVMIYGIIYATLILMASLMMAIVNGSGSVDVEIMRHNMILTECGVSMFPLSIGAGLVLDYALKKNRG